MKLWIWIKSLFRKKPSLTIINTPPEPLAPPWFIVARKEMGIKEYVNGSNPRIVEYHSSTNLKATNDETPWCAAFVCWCLEKSGYVSPKTAWARSFLNWGQKIDTARYGCIVVFKRGSGGHVGFYVSEYPGYILVLGGNQSNAVNVMPYKKSDVLGYRWPVAERAIPYNLG